MKPCIPSRRRGAALLVALLILVLVSSATIVIAGRATQHAAHARTRTSFQVMPLALSAASSAVSVWLQQEQANVVLPVDVSTPAVNVLTSSIEIRGVTVTFQITGFDERGMIAASTLIREPSLVRSVPPIFIEMIEEVHQSGSDPPGIDVLTGAWNSHPRRATNVFPRAKSTDRIGTQSQPTFGGSVSLAPVQPHVNVLTAPWPLIESIADALGRSDLDRIRSARESGTIPSMPVATRRGDDGVPVLAVGSDRWAFRLDIQIDGVVRSFWSVWQRFDRSWNEVQRVIITA